MGCYMVLQEMRVMTVKKTFFLHVDPTKSVQNYISSLSQTVPHQFNSSS